MEHFPLTIEKFGGVFVDMQNVRNDVDYDTHQIFSKSSMENYFRRAKLAMKNLKHVKEKHRRAFCTHVPFKTPSSGGCRIWDDWTAQTRIAGVFY